jgi:hypothetical protein
MSPTAGIPGASRPIPKEMTSVAPAWPRYFLFIPAIVVVPTKATDIIALLIFSDRKVVSTSARTLAGEIPARRTVDDT